MSSRGFPRLKRKKRGRPVKNKIEQIDATPKEITQALVRAAKRKAKERRAQEELA